MYTVVTTELDIASQVMSSVGDSRCQPCIPYRPSTYTRRPCGITAPEHIVIGSTRTQAWSIPPRGLRQPSSILTRDTVPTGRPLHLVLDPLRVLLFALMVVTISRVHQNYPVLETLRPALALVVGSIVYAYLNPRYLTRTNIFRAWPMRLVATLGVLACCSAAFGISLGGSATYILGSYVKTLAFAFLIALSIRHVRDLYTFVWAYVLSCGILSFFAIFVFGMSKASGSFVTRLNDLNMYDSNDIGVVLMVGLPLSLLLLTADRGRKRLLLLAILIGIATTVARSGSRGGFLGFIAVGLGLLVVVRTVSAAQRLIAVVVASITLAFGAPPGYWQQMGTILSPKEDYNYYDVDGRKAVVERGLHYMAEYPAFGLGINNFSRAECSISPKLEFLRRDGPIRCTAPHNSYVQAGSELGIPGLLAWVSLTLGGIFAPGMLRRRLPKAWLRGTPSQRFVCNATSFFTVSMIGFAVTSFFVSFAWMDALYVMAALLTGLYVAAQTEFDAAYRKGAAVPSQPSPKRPAGWRMRPPAMPAP